MLKISTLCNSFHGHIPTLSIVLVRAIRSSFRAIALVLHFEFVFCGVRVTWKLEFNSIPNMHLKTIPTDCRECLLRSDWWNGQRTYEEFSNQQITSITKRHATDARLHNRT